MITGASATGAGVVSEALGGRSSYTPSTSITCPTRSREPLGGVVRPRGLAPVSDGPCWRGTHALAPNCNRLSQRN